MIIRKLPNLQSAFLAFSVLALFPFASHSAAAEESSEGQAADGRWFRCNTHTHTKAFPKSDANASPREAATWYKNHGYQCLFITDHEHLTEVKAFDEEMGDDFLLMAGQEISQAVKDESRPSGVRFGHVNGLAIDKVIMPVDYPNLPDVSRFADIFRINIAAIYEAGGIAQVNHPNLQWSLRLEDILPISQPYLLEVWNAFATSNNLGGSDDIGVASSSPEALWDALLSRGKTVWATASDDAHDYYDFSNPMAPTPGKGWIVVHANVLARDAIMNAIRHGDFYATNGVTLKSYHADSKGIQITISEQRDWNPSQKAGTRYMTRFIGKDGQVLAAISGHSPRYEFKGDESYVRASIIDSDGRRAWTQPVFLDGREADWGQR